MEYKIEPLINNSNKHLINDFLKIEDKFIIDIESSWGTRGGCKSFCNLGFNNIMGRTPYSFYYDSGKKSKYVFIYPENYSKDNYLKNIWNNDILNNYNNERVVYFGQEMEKNFFGYLTRLTDIRNIKKAINFSKSFDMQYIFSKSISENDSPVISFKFTIDGREEIIKTMKLSNISIIVDCIQNNNSRMELEIYRKITAPNWDDYIYRDIDKIFQKRKYNNRDKQNYFMNYNKNHVNEIKNIYTWTKEVLNNYGTK